MLKRSSRSSLGFLFLLIFGGLCSFSIPVLGQKANAVPASSVPTFTECVTLFMEAYEIFKAEPVEIGSEILDFQSLPCFSALQSIYITTSTMRPTLDLDDRLLVDKVVYDNTLPERGDIVVFRPPDRVILDIGADQDVLFIMRIIGLPGETVEVSNGSLFINGNWVSEPYVQDRAEYQFGPVAVPDEQYMVLGDQRNYSNDSSRWGFLPRELIVGKAVGIFCPLERQAMLYDSSATNEYDDLPMHEFFDAIADVTHYFRDLAQNADCG